MLNDFIDLTVYRAKRVILELRNFGHKLETEVDSVQASTGAMIELIDREANIMRKWKNDAEILNMTDEGTMQPAKTSKVNFPAGSVPISVAGFRVE